MNRFRIWVVIVVLFLVSVVWVELVLQGQDVYGDWWVDKFGMVRLIWLQDLVKLGVMCLVVSLLCVVLCLLEVMLQVLVGFRIELFVDGFWVLCIICVVLNGDVFVVEMWVGIICVLCVGEGGKVVIIEVFVSGLCQFFGIVFFLNGDNL